MPPVPSTREIWSSLEEVIGARGSQGVEAHVKCLVLLIYPPLPGFPPVLLVLLFRLLQKSETHQRFSAWVWCSSLDCLDGIDVLPERIRPAFRSDLALISLPCRLA